MKVIFIKENCPNLTYGKQYEALDSWNPIWKSNKDKLAMKITNDIGETIYTNPKSFVSLDEWREMQLEKTLL